MNTQHWISPIRPWLVPTPDSLAHETMPDGWTGLPLASHPGAFGVQRKNHIHEGVDLYCPAGTKVHAVEDGRVVAIVEFTGAKAGSPWWLDTKAILVEGASGVVLYGEIDPIRGMRTGQTLRQNDLIGRVVQVLREDKGRPMAMLHLELHVAGTREASEWILDRPTSLRDPTPRLIDAAMRGWNAPEQPSFVKAGQRLIPIDLVADANITNLEQAQVNLVLRNGETVVADGFDAIEAAWLMRPSSIEGRRLRWRKGAWALHNLFAHPAMQVLAWFGYGRLGVWLHDATTPRPR